MIAFTLVRIRGKSRSITYGAMNIQSPSCGRSGVRDAYAANENLKQSQIWTDHTHSPSHFANLHEYGGNSSAVLRPLALDQLTEAIADLSKSSGILSMAKNGEASPMGPRSIPSRESMVMCVRGVTIMPSSAKAIADHYSKLEIDVCDRDRTFCD